MAFEIPLEADRVDNLDFFSSILRAPVIGTLQWLLGDRGKDAEGPEEPGPEALDGTETLDSPHSVLDQNNPAMKRSKRAGTLKKSAPSLIGSEISDIGEVRESMDTLCLEHGASDFYSGTRYASGSSFKSKKSLSWSDENGQELVENKSSVHEPKPLSEQPKRSAMMRSRSFRDGALAESSLMASTRLNNSSLLKHSLPYTMQHGHGIVEPYSSGTGGEWSPQWGWYINTTPPPPDIYSSRPSKTRKPDSTSDTSQGTATTETSSLSTSYNPGDHSLPNPVFQGLQDKNRAAPLGWHPGVPL